VRRVLVAARLLRRARLHVVDHTCSIVFTQERHDQVHLLDPHDHLAALARRRGHRVQLPLPVGHGDEHLVPLGERRLGPRVVEVEVEVVLGQGGARVVHPLVLAAAAAAAAAATPSSQRRRATQ
ncbi:Os04g0498101, partial [Oryza sativa Japonica Group]